MTNSHRETNGRPPPPAPSSQAAGPETSLSNQEKQILLQVARQTLESYFESRQRPAFDYDSPSLKQQRAVFVTLWRKDTGELRGCRGESIARRPLLDAVSSMAIASAIDDPRFTSVTREETPYLRIEINALTPLEPIRPDDVELGKHGLMVISGSHAGLLLPDVPVRIGWDRIQFLEGVCEKAGLPPTAWQEPDVTLLGFESEEWGESD